MDKKSICDEYRDLLKGIFHYQDHQIEIKITCWKIILGTFAFIGILAFASIGLTNFWFSLTCVFLPIIALFLIIIGFFHDLVYKERLKLGFFSAAVKLEHKYSWLPEFHKSLIGESQIQNMSTRKQISFYLGCGMILLILSSVFLFFLPIFTNIYINSSLFLLLCIIFISYYKFLFHHMKKTKYLFLKEIDIKAYKKRTFTDENIKYLEILHSQGKAFIEHFSNIKMRYKNLPITIITALFLAIAYIIGSQDSFYSGNNFFSQKITFVHQHMIYLICLITTLSVIGIKIIRFLDINISHEQIRLLFKCIIDLEKKCKVSKPYEIISKTLYQKNFDPIFIDFFYYASINLSIIFLGIILLLSHLRDYHSFIGVIISLSIIISLFIWEIISFICIFRKKIKFA